MFTVVIIINSITNGESTFCTTSQGTFVRPSNMGNQPAKLIISGESTETVDKVYGLCSSMSTNINFENNDVKHVKAKQ